MIGQRPRSQAGRLRTLLDYEREARYFYSVAAREPEPPWAASVFESLAYKFKLARKALNVLSDRYLERLRECCFEPPSTCE